MSNSETRVEILAAATALRPTQVESRWAEWKRLGMAGSAIGEMVKSSFGHPMPVDKQGDAGDRMDRLIVNAERSYAKALDSARKSLDLALAIEQGWLIEIHIATKEERAQASDLGVDCLCCSRPVACTPVDPIREGFCDSCSKAWRRADKPDRVKFIRDRRLFLDMAEEATA